MENNLQNTDRIQTLCFLKRLEDLSYSSFLAGLDIKGPQFVPDPVFFLCCQASGQRFEPPPINSIQVCSLKERLGKLASLGQEIGTSWRLAPSKIKEILWKGVDSIYAKNQSILKKLKSLDRNCPFALSQFSKNSFESDLWAIALIAIWRLNLNVAFIDFSRAGVDLKLSDFSRTEPDLILIEGVSGLHRPYTALALESLIKYSYDSGASLIINFRNDVSEKKEFDPTESKPLAYSRRKTAFASRLDKIKKRHPLEQLDASTHMKWLEMAQN